MEADKVKELVAAAWAAVDEAGVGEAAQAVAFEAALQLLVGGELRGPKRAAQDAHGKDEEPLKPHHGADDLKVHEDFKKIAKKLEVDVEDVAAVYRHGEDGELTVDIAMSKLPSTVVSGARDVVLLVAAGRQAALGEGDTDTTNLVPSLEEHKVYDSKNFKSNHLRKEQDRWKVTKGGDAVRVTGDGVKAAAALIKKYAGKSE